MIGYVDMVTFLCYNRKKFFFRMSLKINFGKCDFCSGFADQKMPEAAVIRENNIIF